MSEKKLVALTFDDGPTVGITDRVLDVLEENQVVASFFPDWSADYGRDSAACEKRAHDMGCTIENHSKTHSSMPKLSEQEIVDEIKETSDRIEKIVGEKPEFFRPPYIDYDQKMYDLIDLTFISGYGCEDWLPEVSAKERVERLLKVARPGFMILLHDMADNFQTVETIKILIPELKRQGYEFVTIRDIFLRKSGVKPEHNVVYMSVDEVRENYY